MSRQPKFELGLGDVALPKMLIDLTDTNEPDMVLQKSSHSYDWHWLSWEDATFCFWWAYCGRGLHHQHHDSILLNHQTPVGLIGVRSNNDSFLVFMDDG